MKAPRSGKISSLSLWLLKHSQRADHVFEKAMGVQRGKAFPLWSVSARNAE
jgi:hypothetical protein